MVDPPKTDLGAGANLADSWVDLSGDDCGDSECSVSEQHGGSSSPSPIMATKYDARDYLYRWLLPEHLRPYFGSMTVDSRQLNYPAAVALREQGHTHAWPRMRLLPQGWKWSLHLGQSAHVNMVGSSEKLQAVQWVGSRRPAPHITAQQTCGYVYVDDSSIMGIRRELLSSLHEEYIKVMDLSGMVSNDEKSHGPVLEELHLGLQWYGRCYMLAPRPKRQVTLKKGTLYASSLKRMRVDELEAVVGHIIHNFLIYRLSLSVLDEAYRLIARAKMGGSLRLNVTKKLSEELACCSRLTPHIASHLHAKPCHIVVCSDSSGDMCCVGACDLEPDTVFSEWRWSGKWRSSLEYNPPTTNAERQALSSVAEQTGKLRICPPGEWREKQLKAPLKVTRDTKFRRECRDARRDLAGKGRRDQPIGLPEQVGIPDDLITLYRGSLGIRRSFWELFSDTAEASLWASHQGMDVLTPLTHLRQPRYSILKQRNIPACV